MARARLRDLGILIGRYPPGEHNAITDVPGVLVGHKTLIYDEPFVVRTGVTVVIPRDGNIAKDYAFAGWDALNGFGEMTGLLMMEEFGHLTSPVALTNTSQVGLVRDALAHFGAERHGGAFKIAVVAETYDGWLSDSDALPLTQRDVYDAIEAASSGPVQEGNVGGGTGMICHEFKGGIGTASRIVEGPGGPYVIGALVQANHGDRYTLRVDGVPVGREIGIECVPSPWSAPPKAGSIIVILATDAPLVAVQCKRLARRAAIGMARAGGLALDSSGDIFLAFATGNHYPHDARELVDLKHFPFRRFDPLIEASAEAVEEAILNALTAAETMVGQKARMAHALPLDQLQAIMARYRPG
jgi:D-aminopeptidase